MLMEMEDQVKLIKQRLAKANNRQKSYADTKRTPRQFVVGEKVLLRVKHKKSSIKFAKASKLALRYVGHIEVLEIINPIAYRFALPPALTRLHDVFHVSYLKKYVADFEHMID